MNEWENYIDQRNLDKITEFIREERNRGKEILPNDDNIFRALMSCSLDEVKVVILGQDPYPDPRMADGLAFSSKHPFITPKSLSNIFTEIRDDVLYDQPWDPDTNLDRWLIQGVLLLNSFLTVEAGKPGSHRNIGWQEITDGIIKTISDKRKNIVFILWGGFSKAKAGLIDRSKHKVLEAAHPSPLSAYRGFFGCKHFSKANEYLIENQISPIDWR